MSQVAFIDRLVMSQNYDKSNLKLDLENKATNNRKRKIFGLHSPAALLQSPDLKLLKLASPELEKIIINNNGFLPTPTHPSGTSSSSLLQSGENSAEDSESFARGFIEALQKLQEQDVPAITTKSWDTTTVDTRSETPVAAPAPAVQLPKTTILNPVRWQTDHNRNSVPVITNRYDSRTPPPPISRQPTTTPVLVNFPTVSSTSSVTSMGMTAMPRASTSFITRPEMPSVANRTSQQTSHSLTTSGMTLPSPIAPVSSITNLDPILIKSEEDSLPVNSPNVDLHLDMNPIDLSVQEHIKHQRKKLRNRLAAQRCRKRKIEREDTLKAKVKELKQKNADLTSLSRDLRMQVCELKQQVMQHLNQGCHIFMKDNDTDKTENT